VVRYTDTDPAPETFVLVDYNALTSETVLTADSVAYFSLPVAWR